jgi:hypothetical protein
VSTPWYSDPAIRLALVAAIASVIAAIAGVYAVIVVKKQSQIMVQQSRIMVQQLALMERQNEILARRPVLRLLALVHDADRTVELRMRNTGTRGTSGYYWDLDVPEALGVSRLPNPFEQDHSVRDHIQVDGTNYYHFTEYETRPVYPTRESTIATFTVPEQAAPGTYSLRWRAITEDGIFPSEGELGRIVLSVERRQNTVHVTLQGH